MDGRYWEIVYHYTSLDGLNRILSAGALSLTDIIKSNDPAEGFYSLQMLEKAYQKLYQFDKIGTETYHKFHRVFFEFSETEKAFGRLQQVILSISFCEPDLPLALWRTYGDNGRGAAIGISKEKLRHLAESPAFEFKPIEYVSESELLDRYCSFWLNHKDSDSATIEEALKTQYLDGYFIKRQENYYEREWRLVYTGLNLTDYCLLPQEIPAEVRYYMRADDVVIFYQLGFRGEENGIAGLDSVCIGPQCKITDNEMRWLLKKHNIVDCSVCHDNTVMR